MVGKALRAVTVALSVLLAAGAPLPPAALADTLPAPRQLVWPRTLPGAEGSLTIYQPQVESWKDGVLIARAAISVTPTGGAPVFGVAAIRAETQIDKASGLVLLAPVSIDKVEIPTAPARAEPIRALLQSKLPAEGLTVALAHLSASYEVAQDVAQQQEAVPVRNDVPQIIFSPVPSVLVLVDGAPVLRPLPPTPYQRVINTRVLLVQAPDGSFHLKAAGRWYAAPGLDAPWQAEAKPAQGLAAAEKAANAGTKPDPLPMSDPKAPPPVVFVSTGPAELIQTDGEPLFAPVEGLTLLELRNGDHAIFLDPTSNSYYVLVSGRWFRAGQVAGPWSYVPGEQLPADFARIPPDDPKAAALASVPGTPQAREAAIQTTIPQTATVQRGKSALVVPYDGAPRFEPIAGTTLFYAVNTPIPVIKAAGRFYAVAQGVWFVAAQPTGPWQVADSVPPVIYTIPPSSPIYYVTYVRIYQTTPTTVVVGYMPGYLGVAVSPAGTVVYGTGYAYPPYVGTVYYGYPQTYGYGAGFAVGGAVGFAFGFAAGAYWGGGCTPYWGPYWSHNGNYNSWNNVNINQVNIYNSWNGNRATVTTASGWNNNGSWRAGSATAFNPYTGATRTVQGGAVHNDQTGASAAGVRSGYYNPQTGAAAGQRAGVAVNGNGDYAAGRQAAGYNPETGRAATASRTVTGNVQDGTRNVNSQGAAVNVQNQSGVAWKNGNVYAGHDGNVYQRQEGGGWEQQSGNGWQPVQPSFNQSQTGQSLQRDYQGRANGQQRYQSWSGGAGGNAGGAQQPFWGQGRARGR
ncbi:MAG: hypothetical protein U1E53_17260 [Dongiaceae bacterium]